MTELARSTASSLLEIAAVPVPQRDDFWLRHAWMPLLLFVPLFFGIEWTGLDRVLAHAFFYDAVPGRWLGAGPGEWWARGILHDGGRWLARTLAGTALALWAASFLSVRMRPWRRGAGFVFLAMAASVLIVGGLKLITDVDCPWDLHEFGGDRPYIGLFALRPHDLPRAQCFPGAHSSSGFALVALYFVFRDRSRAAATGALLLALLVWALFALGQEARGAHFLSHDLTSLALVWFVQLGIYVKLLRQPHQRVGGHAEGQAAEDVAREDQPQAGRQHADQARVEQ
jgi:membrane-associated PAP2 superfamily phosphatase